MCVLAPRFQNMVQGMRMQTGSLRGKMSRVAWQAMARVDLARIGVANFRNRQVTLQGQDAKVEIFQSKLGRQGRWGDLYGIFRYGRNIHHGAGTLRTAVHDSKGQRGRASISILLLSQPASLQTGPGTRTLEETALCSTAFPRRGT